MVRAVWKGEILAECDVCEFLEGSYYFPRKSVKTKYLKKSTKHAECKWKGKVNFYDVVVKGEKNKDAAWFFPNPKKEARSIKDHIAFWKGVKIEV